MVTGGPSWSNLKVVGIMKKKTIFTMYGGLRTIGGVIFSVVYGKDRVILEFGSAYDPATAVFDGKVLPRKENWIRDRLKVGLLPRIDGIYLKADLGDFPLISAEESEWNTAVFITHLHLDHMAQIGMIAPSVPVYMHRNAQIIERALEATGNGVDTLEREYRDIVPFETIRVGEIEVLPILCRDTSYYDFAFLITTPDGTIHWTGDLTLHSDKKELTLRQMDMLIEQNVDVLLCDCTAFMDSVLHRMVPDCDAKKILPNPELPVGMLSDAQYYNGLFENVKRVKGLCVFNYYEREMDDAQQLMQWAQATDKRCVFEPESAYIVYKFFGIEPNVYVPDVAGYDGKRQENWMRELLEHCTLVSRDEICAAPGRYMLQNTYPNIMELFSLPSENAVYLHADGIPIGSFDPAYGNMRKIVEKTGFEYVTFFCENYFGHGYPQQVKWFVDQINPKVLIPCHSYNPERLFAKDGVQLLPKMYQAYTLENHVFSPLEEGDR